MYVSDDGTSDEETQEVEEVIRYITEGNSYS